MTTNPKKQTTDDLLTKLLCLLASQHLRFGYRRLWLLARRKKRKVNHKRVYRIYRENGLGLRRSRKRKRVDNGDMMSRALRPNAIWAIDNTRNQLASGRRTRILNGIDESTILCVLADVSRLFPAERVIEALEKAIVRVGKPACYEWTMAQSSTPKSSSNGPEAVVLGLSTLAVAPPHVESLNSKVRSELLDMH